MGEIENGAKCCIETLQHLAEKWQEIDGFYMTDLLPELIAAYKEMGSNGIGTGVIRDPGGEPIATFALLFTEDGRPWWRVYHVNSWAPPEFLRRGSVTARRFYDVEEAEALANLARQFSSIVLHKADDVKVLGELLKAYDHACRSKYRVAHGLVVSRLGEPLAMFALVVPEDGDIKWEVKVFQWKSLPRPSLTTPIL